MADPPAFSGLTDTHRQDLKDWFPAYIAALTHADRRTVALRAVDTLAPKYDIVRKEDLKAFTSVWCSISSSVLRTNQYGAECYKLPL